MPKWTGKVLATFPSVPPRTPTNGLPHPHWTPNRGWVPLSVGTPPLPQPPLRGAGPIGLAFTFAPPSLPPAPSGPMAGGGLGGQRIRPGISAGSRVPKWARENWPCSLLILCPLSGPTISPFGRGIPSPPPATPQGCQCHPASTSPAPHSPPTPHPTWLLGVPPVPLGVHGPPLCLVGALLVRRQKFYVLLVRHLDSAPLPSF